MNQVYKIYNLYLNQELSINDAIKITTIPQYESFWVSIENIKQDGDLECRVQNILFKKHNFNYGDIIIIKPKYIKEYKKKSNRFNLNILSLEDKNLLLTKYYMFKINYNREPNFEEIETLINTKINYLYYN